MSVVQKVFPPSLLPHPSPPNLFLPHSHNLEMEYTCLNVNLTRNKREKDMLLIEAKRKNTGNSCLQHLSKADAGCF